MPESNTKEWNRQEWGRQRRARLKKAGLCTACGKQSPAEGVLKCKQCNDKYLESAKAAHAKRYPRLKQEGLCVRSCGRPAVPGTTRCQECTTVCRPRQRKSDLAKRAECRANGICVECRKQKAEEGFRRCKPCRQRYNVYQKARNKIVKDAAFEAYGGYKCACCGETHEEFLQIDHTEGNGAEHRRNEPSAYKIYEWLRKHKYPAGFRVLCSNCNWAYGRYGYCPHQKSQGRELCKAQAQAVG